MPTATPTLLRGLLLHQLARAYQRLPKSAQQVALFVLGLWLLVGEVIRLVDAAIVELYPATNARNVGTCDVFQPPVQPRP